MARRKQAHPIQHQNSNLSTSGFLPSSLNGANGKGQQAWPNGVSSGNGVHYRSNGAAMKGGKTSTNSGKEKQAGGLMELVICVGGIYVSLYVRLTLYAPSLCFLSLHYKDNQLTTTFATASPGLSSRSG